MGNEKTLKFVRALRVPVGASQTQPSLALFKLLYEFWGFCVNGGSSLRTPGGFASNNLGVLTASYLSMPAGFESGSCLLASGSDGSTTYGDSVFQAPSVNWTSGSMAGKYLVTWQSGSTSTDDSIYPIVSVVNSSSIIVDTNCGGTPMSGSGLNRPRFTTRSSINFRVIDMSTAMTLPGFAAPNYMVFQLNGPAINAGQAFSQAKLTYRTAGYSFPVGTISLSQSGSWNGTSFTDGTPELPPDVVITEGSASAGTGWYNSTGGSIFYTFIADQAALLCESHGDAIQSPLTFHIEVPTRLYPQSKDPNPICAVSTSFRQSSTPTRCMTTTLFTHPCSYGSGWICPNALDNTVTRRYYASTKSMTGIFYGGSAIGSLDSGDATFLRDLRFNQAFYNPRTRKYSIFDIVLAHRSSGLSYSMGRVQVRRAAFVPGTIQQHTKLGANGEWMMVTEGIVWPWDNSQLPYGLFSVMV